MDVRGIREYDAVTKLGVTTMVHDSLTIVRTDSKSKKTYAVRILIIRIKVSSDKLSHLSPYYITR